MKSNELAEIQIDDIKRFVRFPKGATKEDENKILNQLELDLAYETIKELRSQAKTKGYRTEMLAHFMVSFVVQLLIAAAIIAAFYGGVMVGIIGG